MIVETETKKNWKAIESFGLLALVVAIVLVLFCTPESDDNGEEIAVDSAGGAESEQSTSDSKKETPEVEVVFLPFEKASEGLPSGGEWRGKPAVADVDLDGNLDIVTALRKLKNKGPKAFSDPPAKTEEPEGAARNAGTHPMVSKPTTNSGLFVFKGDGKGNWIDYSEGITPGLGYGGADTADFNGDGNPDLAFATHSGPMKVFLGDGKGTWSDFSQGINNPSVINDMAAADLDGDGLPDIAGISMFPQGGGGIYIFKNLGQQGWAPMNDKPLMGDGVYGNYVHPVDIDKDSDIDLVVTTVEGLKVFMNDGKGNFTDESAGLPRPHIGNSLTVVTSGDLNGDGALEIVLGSYPANEQPGIEIYTRDDSAEGVLWKRIFVGPYVKDFIFGIGVGDMDRDGDLDLVISSFHEHLHGRVTLFDNDGKGFFTEKGRIEGAMGKASLKLADFNNDGKLDVVTVFSQGEGGVEVFLQK